MNENFRGPLESQSAAARFHRAMGVLRAVACLALAGRVAAVPSNFACDRALQVGDTYMGQPAQAADEMCVGASRAPLLRRPWSPFR